MKNIILNSLKESFSLIWKNKSLFALLFALQITFFAIFFSISLTYQTRILESAKAITNYTDYLSQQKLDDVSVASSILQQKNILGDDPLSISRNFKDMVKNFRLYLISIFIFLVIFMSISWMITIRMIYGKIYGKKFLCDMRVSEFANSLAHKLLTKIFFKMFVILLFYLGLIFLFFFSLFSISLTGIGAESAELFTKYVPFLIFSIALAYFMFISLSLSHNTELKNIVQKTLSIGLKKAYYILAVYFINISLMAISLISLFYLFEKKSMALPLIFFIFSFVFGRIFMVKAVDKLEKL